MGQNDDTKLERNRKNIEKSEVTWLYITWWWNLEILELMVCAK